MAHFSGAVGLPFADRRGELSSGPPGQLLVRITYLLHLGTLYPGFFFRRGQSKEVRTNTALSLAAARYFWDQTRSGSVAQVYSHGKPALVGRAGVDGGSRSPWGLISSKAAYQQRY